MSWKSRYSILAILFATYLLLYVDRMVMATAIPFIAQEFQLSPLAMGGVLSAFFLGYSAMQIPGGLLADRLGPNRVMTASIISWSIFTALTGVASSLTALLTIRVLFGLSEGPFPPAASKTIASWFPRRELGRASGLQYASVPLGAAFAPIFVAALVNNWGWRSAFYSLLLPGLLLAIVIKAFIKDSPAQSKRISGEELAECEADQVQMGSVKMGAAQLLRMPAVIWCCITYFVMSLASWSLTNWLPTYLLQVRGFGVTKMGLFASLPFLAGATGFYLGGYISDKYFSERRKIPILLSFLLCGSMTYLAAAAPTGEWAVAYLALAFVFLYMASAGLLTLPLVLVPRELVGAAFGIVNTAGQFAAFLSPLLVGYVLGVTTNNFTLVFYGIVTLFLLAACTVTRIKQSALINEFAR